MVFLFNPPVLSELLATTDFLPYVHFSECYIIRIIQCILFSDWLISLNNMYLKFNYVISWLNRPFFILLNKIPLYEYTAGCLSTSWRAFWLLPVFVIVNEQQSRSCWLLPPSRQNSRGKGLVIKERSLYSKASQFWNNSFVYELVT